MDEEIFHLLWTFVGHSGKIMQGTALAGCQAFFLLCSLKGIPAYVAAAIFQCSHHCVFQCPSLSLWVSELCRCSRAQFTNSWRPWGAINFCEQSDHHIGLSIPHALINSCIHLRQIQQLHSSWKTSLFSAAESLWANMASSNRHLRETLMSFCGQNTQD